MGRKRKEWRPATFPDIGLCVYVLLCPINDDVRYVGATRKPRERKHAHTRRLHTNPKYPIQFWTNELVRAGTPPKFRIVCRIKGRGLFLDPGGYVFCPESAMRDVERKLIQTCHERGCNLLNIASLKMKSK